MPEGAICIGFGEKDGVCTNAIDAEALRLNGSGLWCISCETARRTHLTKQFDAISKSFDCDTEGERG